MKITILNKLIFKSVKGCDSYFKVKCSNFQSRYKWNNYTLHLTWCTINAIEIYIIVTDMIFNDNFYLDLRA